MTTTYLPDVDVTTIDAHGANPRKDIGDITDLAASIKAVGILEPLVLAPLNGSGSYRLIAGHRRLAAAIDAGLTTVPALSREDLDTEPKQLEAMLVENTQRVDLTPVEEAQAYAQLVAFPGYTPAKAAKATGRSLKTVKGRLAIAALPKATLDKMDSGQISLTDAQTLAEFAGTKHFTKLSKSIGSNNFAYDVRRIREDIKFLAQIERIREHFQAKGWDEAPERPAGARQSVASSWDRGAASAKKLDALDGPHVLVVSDTSWGGVSWQIFPKPSDAETAAAEAERAKVDTKRLAQDSRDYAAERRAEEEQLAALMTARDVRGEYLTGRLDKLVLNPAEKVALLRLLAEDLADRMPDADDMAAAGLPEDGTSAEFLAAASENQLWKAVVVLALELGSNGYSYSSSHVMPIRAAIALGYTPSDVELALIAPDTSGET